MPYRPHGRASVNPSWPQAWATCDRCGLNYNLVALNSERQWAGVRLIATGFLVCQPCLDIPQEQLRTIVLPADPPGLMNPRPEPYELDETSWRATQDSDIRETQDDKLRIIESGADDSD